MGLKIRFFKSIPYLWALVFATSLVLVQLLERTDPLFVVCSFVYVCLATVAFNIADGLTTLPGVFVFCTAFLTCLVGIVTKAILGEPGQSNLKNGVVTMEVYVLGMLVLTGAVIVERHFRPSRPLLPAVFPLPNLTAAYLGCAILGVITDTYLAFVQSGKPGSVTALLSNANHFTAFAIVLGTMVVVKRSHGRLNISPLLLFLLLFSTLRGFLTFSKEGMFTPSVAWILGMAASRYRLKPLDLGILAGALFFMVRFAVPYSQFGRNFKPEDTTVVASMPIAVYFLENFDVIDKGYAESKQEGDPWRYFNGDLGQMERLSMLPPDDDLISYTDSGHVFGLTPLKEELENLVPHFLWKNKPVPYFGNVYWHELGLAPDNDTETGISFSPTADLYHQGELKALLLLGPILASCAFLLFSFVLGKVESHPATLLGVLAIAHLAPEAGTNAFVSVVPTILGVLFVAVLCHYVFPVLGSILPMKTIYEGLNDQTPLANTARSL